MEGYLVVIEKVQPGDTVRVKDASQHLFPEKEYSVIDVETHVYGGCEGNIIDAQFLILEGLKGKFSSEHFILYRTVISHEALDVFLNNRQRMQEDFKRALSSI